MSPVSRRSHFTYGILNALVPTVHPRRRYTNIIISAELDMSSAKPRLAQSLVATLNCALLVIYRGADSLHQETKRGNDRQKNYCVGIFRRVRYVTAKVSY